MGEQVRDPNLENYSCNYVASLETSSSRKKMADRGLPGIDGSPRGFGVQDRVRV